MRARCALPAALGAAAVRRVQIALGGWVSAQLRGARLPRFSDCATAQWLPAMDFAHGFHVVRELGRTADGELLSRTRR